MADEAPYAAYRERAKEFAKDHRDFETVLNSATARELSLSVDAVDEIWKLRSPEVAYYLASPENEGEARIHHGLSGKEARDRIRFQHERLQRQNTFTPAPAKQVSTDNADSYIEKRREEKRR